MGRGATRELRRLRVRVRGRVQGVGFRPFVYGLAARFGLAGWVLNDGDGVLVEIEGPEVATTSFVAALTAEAPPSARIDAVTSALLPPEGDAGFAIRPSDRSRAIATAIPPDVATCPDCL
ncbi:MAG: acylphosphatase, partial [Rhodospirillaceae bacterium]